MKYSIIALVLVLASCGVAPAGSLVGTWRQTTNSMCAPVLYDLVINANGTYDTVGTVTECNRAGCVTTTRTTGRTWVSVASSHNESAITSLTTSGTELTVTQETHGCVNPALNTTTTAMNPFQGSTVEYHVDADTLSFGGTLYYRVTE